MEKLARYLSRTAGVAAALTLAGATVAGARAGAAPHPGTVGGTAYHPVNLTASGSLAGKSGGTHYLYVDEGNSGGTADNIEAFKIVGTSASWLQTFPSGANQTIAFFGSNTLALRPSKKGKSECLVLTDAGNGMIRSYSVATSGSSQGQITGQVSAVADPNGYTPEQVTVSSNGTWAFLVDASAYVSTWTIAGNCGLTLASSSKGATDFPNYQQAEEVGSTQLVANDDGNNKIDTYSVNPSTGALTYTQSTSSPAIQPDGLFVSGTKVFTGALTNPTIAQAGTLQGGTVQFVQG
ncbi:MAG TPA: hypothetical protein VKX16_05605, partial [Chloroflexota bacterium]|nr:hypothetical protein [Chloroflexota bacterium]